MKLYFGLFQRLRVRYQSVARGDVSADINLQNKPIIVTISTEGDSRLPVCYLWALITYSIALQWLRLEVFRSLELLPVCLHACVGGNILSSQLCLLQIESFGIHFCFIRLCMQSSGKMTERGGGVGGGRGGFEIPARGITSTWYSP